MIKLKGQYIYPNRKDPDRWGKEVILESLDSEKVMFPFLEEGTPENYAEWLKGSIKKGKVVNEFNYERIGSIYIAKDNAIIIPFHGATTGGIDNVIIPKDADIAYISNTDNIAQGFWAHFNLYFMNGFEQPPNCDRIPVYPNVLPFLKEDIYDEYYQVLAENIKDKNRNPILR